MIYICSLFILFFLTCNVPLKVLGKIASSKFILIFVFLEFIKIKGEIFSLKKKDCILFLLLISVFYTLIIGENYFSYMR